MTQGNNQRQTAPESFEQHERYAEFLKQKASGEDEAAVQALRDLVEIYPDDERLSELLLRTELEVAVGSSAAVPVDRRAAPPLLRTLLVTLIILTASLGLIAGLLAANEQWVEPTATATQRRQEIASLQREAEQRLEAGDWDGAEAKLNELAEADPGNALVEDWRQRISEGRALDERYLAGVNAQGADNRAEALAIFLAIDQEYPDFRDVSDRIAAIRTQEALDTTWQEAEAAVAARDWPLALELLETIRERDPSRRALAEQRLYEIYAQLGRQEIERAGGDLDRLRQAAVYLRRALQLMPSDQALAREKALAEDYVAGFDAYARQDWVTSVQRWEEVFQIQRDYGDGRLGERLEQLYPQAAQQLISEANGRTEPLEQAVVYLDRAIADQPEDEGLLNERHLLVEYLAGADTFQQDYWDLTITRWGPIYKERPDYQNGVLKEELTDACGQSDDPDPAYCPP